MAKKRKKNDRSRSIIWRIHGSWLLKLFFVFLVCDAIIMVMMMPFDVLERGNGEQIAEQVVLLKARLKPLFTFQFVYWTYTLLFGSGSIHRALRPLTRLAETTQALSHEELDDEVFHQLENAIGRISPKSNETLHTGNSELQGLEKAVNSLLERMRQTYSQQARFVSDASHELRTPIAVIQGYANMLERWGKSDPKVLDEAITAINSESRHMQLLIEQLLFLARSDSGRNPLTMADFSMNEMVSETVDEYEMINTAHKWKLRLPEDEIVVRGDEAMLKQALRILCDNAVKYSPDGSQITVALGKENGRAFFSVQDEGIGISPKDQAHVFERFFRADPSRVRETGGTGLGLSIAQWIIERHGGRIDILSREDIGTRMTVSIPF